MPTWITLPTFLRLLLLAGLLCAGFPASTAAASAGAAPAAIPATGAPMIAAGGTHTCAILPDGSPFCWGYMDYGSAVPGSYVQIAAGGQHTCAVKTDGSVACWGYDGATGQTTPPVGTFSQVSAGMQHTCGVKTDNTIACWGKNDLGQAPVAPFGSFSQVSAGFYHTCAVKSDSSTVCWGSNGHGEATPPAGSFTQVSGGFWHSCGLKTDGTLACWGSNDAGQTTPPAGTFTQVGTGQSHSCGLRTDRTIACWGYNLQGQSIPPAGTFSQVSVGANHNCALRADGVRACWGANDYQQAPRLELDPATLPGGAAGVAYAQTITAANGTSPYAYALGSDSLPSGLSVNPATGALSGIPTEAGSFTFTVEAVDASALPLLGQREYTLVFSKSDPRLRLSITNSREDPITEIVYGAPFFLDAEVDGSDAPPTGEVVFRSTSSSICFGRLNYLGEADLRDGQAQFAPADTLNTGTKYFQATYAGDAAYNATTSGCVALTITPRTLSVTAAAEDKVYDGATAAAVTLSDNRLFGDVLTLSYSAAAFDSKDAGASKPVTVAGLALSGADAANYSLASTTASCHAAITPRPITVTADPQVKYPGQPDPALTYTITSGSLLSGDSLTGAPARVPGEAVGSYAIQPGTLTAGTNYAITFVTADLTIQSYRIFTPLVVR